MFDLHIADTDVTGGSIPVSWCLRPEALKEIKAQFGDNPNVVLILAPKENYHIRREVRQVVPLRDLMTYLAFKSGGTNRIWAFISGKEDARRSYLCKSEGQYITSLLNEEGDGWSYRFLKHVFDKETGRDKQVYQPEAYAVIEVEVPQAAFASEPPAWEKKWVEHFFSYKAFDQCEYRRRRLFAYTVQPALMMLLMFLRLVLTLAALAFGARNFSWQPLVHPMKLDFQDQLEIFGGGSVFIRKARTPSFHDSFKEMCVYGIRKYCLLPFMPPILAVLIFLAVSNVWMFISVGLSFLAIVVGALFSVYLLVDRSAEIKNWLTKLQSKADSALSAEELEYLTCSPDKKPFTLETLPTQKKTIRLRFQDLKSKVCRPFSV